MKSKEVRRLIKFGDSSHVVSIPKDWIEKNNLQKGDLIFLDENEFGQLLISPDQKKIERVDRGISVCIDKKNEEGNHSLLFEEFFNNKASRK
jgi:bifunctional DNA-binding transcriptional regulator/antitoxin component of YhaV-PrlF toxin-antitoxin module